MASLSNQETHWRIVGPYLSTLASKAALLEETRLFLVTYSQYHHDLDATTKALLDTILPQRSRITRSIIVKIIKSRLMNWHPPIWVLQDLISFAHEPNLDALRAALLLHVPRQDHLLYDFVQQVIVPREEKGESKVFISDVQTFLDIALDEHAEISHWSVETRLRAARGVLTTLRDYGLLKGEVNKSIALPAIPDNVVHHLIRLLQAEGLPQEQVVYHPDWQLWLWQPAQVKVALTAFLKQGQIA